MAGLPTSMVRHPVAAAAATRLRAACGSISCGSRGSHQYWVYTWYVHCTFTVYDEWVSGGDPFAGDEDTYEEAAGDREGRPRSDRGVLNSILRHRATGPAADWDEHFEHLIDVIRPAAVQLAGFLERGWHEVPTTGEILKGMVQRAQAEFDLDRRVNEELEETKKYAYTFKEWARGTDAPRPRFAAGDAGGDAAGDPTEDPEELAHFLADRGDGLCGHELCDDDFDSMAAGGLAVGEGA